MRFEIFIRTTPEKLWQALTDGEFTKHYHFGSAVEGDWRVGGKYRFPNPEGGLFLEGEVLEIEPPKRLVTTFRDHCVPEHTHTASKVTWEITQIGEVCKLALTHEELLDDEEFKNSLISGWSEILSGIKTLLETGKPLGLTETSS